MSNVVFKYEVPIPVDPAMVSEIALPEGATILSAGCQEQRLYVWALVDSLAPVIHTWTCKVIGTGWLMPDDELDGYTFVGTVFMDWLVWHVWVKP